MGHGYSMHYNVGPNYLRMTEYLRDKSKSTRSNNRGSRPTCWNKFLKYRNPFHMLWALVAVSIARIKAPFTSFYHTFKSTNKQTSDSVSIRKDIPENKIPD